MQEARKSVTNQILETGRVDSEQVPILLKTLQVVTIRRPGRKHGFSGNDRQTYLWSHP